MFSPPLPTRAVAVSVNWSPHTVILSTGLPYKRVYYLHLSSWSATAKTNPAAACYNHGILRGSTDICTSLTFLGRACPQTFLQCRVLCIGIAAKKKLSALRIDNIMI